MLNISLSPQLALVLIALSVAAAGAAALLAWLERRRNHQLRTRVLEVARHLARRNFGHTMESRSLGALGEIAQAFDRAGASLRRHEQQTAALLELDRTLLRGGSLDAAVPELLPAIAQALHSRCVSLVLLDAQCADRARSYDYLAEQGGANRGAAPTSRSVVIDADQLRGAPGGGREVDVSAVGVDSEEFLAPLTHSGARAFRLCVLENGARIAGFLCIGFRVDAHDNDQAEVGAVEIAERLSMALTARDLNRAPAAPLPLGAAPRAPTETSLHRALKRGEFTLVYQPIVDAHSHHVGGVEALLRWPRGMEGPSRAAAEFIPVAEQSGLIVDLGDWVLRTACLQFDLWRREGVDLDYVSVNVSARQLRYASLLPTVLACLQRSAMRPGQLQIEVNEQLLRDGAESLAVLRELARRGVRLALDDFGAGQSSLGALQELPIHALKIDRSCVAGMAESATQRAIVAAAIGMGAASRRRVIAEGVETEAQREFLEAAGCDAMQGFLFGRPMTAADLPAFLEAGRPAAALVA